MSRKIAATLSGAACALALHVLPARAQDYDMLWGPGPEYPPAMMYPRDDRAPAFRRRAKRRSYFGQFGRRARPHPVARGTSRRRPDESEGGAPSGPRTSHAGGAYRTLCVRSCDGYYWPISYATPKSRFQGDEKLCRASCPNQTVALYTHRTEGEASDDAVSLKGTPMSKLKNAFVYRQEYRSECTCKMRPPLVASSRGSKRRARAGGGSPTAASEGKDRNGRPAAARKADADPGATGSVARKGEPNRNAAPANEPAEAQKPDPARRIRIVGPRFLVDH